MTTESLLLGLKLFRTNCAGCHGDYAAKSEWGTKNFYPRVPQFGSEPPLWTEAQIHFIVQHGIRNSGMAGWNGLLIDEDMWKVSAFLSRLRSLPAPVDVEWKRR